MVTIEILPNPNCEAMELRVFHDLEPPRSVAQVRLERSPRPMAVGRGEPGTPAWHDVTGWTTAGIPCPAVAQKVDDSGDGVALLIRGGDAGVRLRPASARPVPGRAASASEWCLDAPDQWGEPFLLIADSADVR